MISRRRAVTGLCATAGLSLLRRNGSAGAPAYDTIVVGAGVFGAWTAWHLHQAGERVLLLDGAGPANARASSGGESRMTRSAYGPDEIYTRMARDSLTEWRWLSTLAGLPIFHQLGVLFFFGRREAYVDQTLEVHRRLGLATRILDRAQLAANYPQVDWRDIELGIYEPDFGALMARRAVQTLVRHFTESGGTYRDEQVAVPASGVVPGGVDLAGGGRLTAGRIVYCCGPWLPKLFPELLGPRIFPTRQEVFFFAPPAGDARFLPGQLPGWADFNAGDIYYGFPDLESRGFKIAHDRHGASFDPDLGDRRMSAEGLADVRSYMTRRFPALATSPLTESRVCQYENSSNGDFLIDRHPEHDSIFFVGAGSGHGFKHGPAVGRYAADLVTGRLRKAEPRFSLASKAAEKARSVH